MMTNKGKVTSLREVLEAKEYIGVCLQENAYVVCVNKDTKETRAMPFGAMYGNNKEFWLQRSNWDFYLVNEDVAKFKEKVERPTMSRMPEPTEKKPEAPPLPHAPETVARPEPVVVTAVPEDEMALAYGRDYSAVFSMDESHRVKHLKKEKERLEGLISMKPRQEELIAEALVETARDAILHNHASIVQALSLPDNEAKIQTKQIVDTTRDLVDASVKLISTNIFNSDLMNTLVMRSNGTVIQHMTRVYLNGLAFLSYFNNYVSSTNVINRIRVTFNERYRRFYQTLLPHIHKEQVTLERVFLGGMRAAMEEDFYNWAAGFLVHDIGKAPSVEYHESEEAYNREIVVQHVKVGFANVLSKTGYPHELAMITGYHHEYYGDAGGYGVFRSSYDKYKKESAMRHNHCISYDRRSVLEFKVLAYFPAKVLEIVDVFDSLTDPSRKYRKAVGTEEALHIMREEFIEKHSKLDIILFDIFADFATKARTASVEKKTIVV